MDVQDIEGPTQFREHLERELAGDSDSPADAGESPTDLASLSDADLAAVAQAEGVDLSGITSRAEAEQAIKDDRAAKAGQ